MKALVARRASAVAVAVTLVSCGGHDGVAPQLPTGSSVAPSSSASGSDVVMEASQGIAPVGFKVVLHLDPKPGEDGTIRGTSPVTVDVDLCNSTVEPAKTAHFLFDWDFNGVADVVGTGDTCHQTHTYRAAMDAAKDVVLESNVCVTNGDPGVHGGGTYFSCRKLRVDLPARHGTSMCESGAPAGCYAISGSPFFLSWPGGAGPVPDPLLFTDPGCTSSSGGIVFPLVLACTEAQAQERCGLSDVYGFPFQGGSLLLFACGYVPPGAQAKGLLEYRSDLPRQ